MASPSSVLTRGFGSWGSVNLVVTRGYGVGTAGNPKYPGAGTLDRGGPVGVLQNAGPIGLIERGGLAGTFDHGGVNV